LLSITSIISLYSPLLPFYYLNFTNHILYSIIKSLKIINFKKYNLVKRCLKAFKIILKYYCKDTKEGILFNAYNKMVKHKGIKHLHSFRFQTNLKIKNKQIL